MKTTAKLTSKGPVGQVNIKGRVTTNPLQTKAADGEEELLQKKLNPLQLAGDEGEELLQKKQNPLQLKHIHDNPLKPVTNTGNPMQQATATQSISPFQLFAGAGNSLVLQKTRKSKGILYATDDADAVEWLKVKVKGWADISEEDREVALNIAINPELD